jgi:hypothetical protein
MTRPLVTHPPHKTSPSETAVLFGGVISVAYSFPIHCAMQYVLTARTTNPMAQSGTDDLTAFLLELYREEASPRTIASYRSDLACFARWYSETNGEPFSARVTTPTDVRDYKAHLVAVEHRDPATVNRRLAALRKNPVCGDEVTIQLALEHDRIEAVRFLGC